MRALLGLLLCAAALGAPPQTGKKSARTSLRVTVSAPGPPLAAGELAAMLNGAQTRVISVKSPGDDMIVLLALDLTGDLTLADLARQALVENLQLLPAKTWVTTLRVQDGVRVLLDPTEDRDKTAEVIRSCAVSGKAGLLDSVPTLARLADAVLTRANVRAAVVYVTDSNIYNYREDFTNPVINWSDSRDMSRHFPEGLVKDKISKLDTALAATQAPVFVVHLDYRTDRLNEAYQSGLMQLCATTGGAAVFCRSTGDIGPSIARALETVRSLYSVTVELPKGAGKSIQVQLEAGGRQLNYRGRFALENK